DRIDQLLIATHVWHRRVETRATEIRQVFRIRRAAHKQSLARVFSCNCFQHHLPQLGIKLRRLDLLSQLDQLFAPVSGIVNKLLIVQQSEDYVVEFVLLDEVVVVVERNREATRNDDARQTRVQHFAEIRRLATERQTRRRTLLGQAQQT